MANCSPHREFLAAVADGATDLVPSATLEHVKGCEDCRREVQTHRLLSSRLRDASDLLDAPVLALLPSISQPARAARFRMIAAGAAAAVVLAATGLAWFAFSRPDPVQAAVTASSQPLQIESGDPSRVAQWCTRASGRSLPAVVLDGMQVVGARMDRVASTDIVTVAYTAPSGARVSVSWLEGAAPAGSGVEVRQVGDNQLLIVHSSAGTAVVMSPSTGAMWQTAAAIESAGT